MSKKEEKSWLLAIKIVPLHQKPCTCKVMIPNRPPKSPVLAFGLPFEGKLNPKNRWCILATLLPWDTMAAIYNTNLCADNGRPALNGLMLKFIDLFAGIGGFHLALQKLRHQCVFAYRNRTLKLAEKVNMPHQEKLRHQ